MWIHEPIAANHESHYLPVPDPSARTSDQQPYRPRELHSFPTRRSSDLEVGDLRWTPDTRAIVFVRGGGANTMARSEEHTSELQSRRDIVCRLMLEKKKCNR